MVGEQLLGVSSCFVQCFVHNKHPRDRPPQQIQQDQKRLQRHKHTKGGSRLPGLTRRGGKESTPSKDQRPKDTHTHTRRTWSLLALADLYVINRPHSKRDDLKKTCGGVALQSPHTAFFRQTVDIPQSLRNVNCLRTSAFEHLSDQPRPVRSAPAQCKLPSFGAAPFLLASVHLFAAAAQSTTSQPARNTPWLDSHSSN